MTGAPPTLWADPTLDAVRAGVAGLEDESWLVGGTVRDALLRRPLRDVDLAVQGDAEAVARAVGRALGGPAFALSERFGAWRVLDRARERSCDVSPLQGHTIVEDLAARDFTVNAMALALDAGESLIDPVGGRADLEAGVLRVLGPGAYRADPLRPLRLARLATELGLSPDPETERLTREAAGAVTRASPERVWGELRLLLVAERVTDGLALAGRLGLVDAVLPEVAALEGVGQSHFHHLDVHSHTLEALARLIELERDPAAVFGPHAPALAAVLDEPLADELSRGQALRMAALLHDIGKPATREERPDGRPTFFGHDAAGEQMVGAICRRLRTSERLRSFLAAVTRHHLALGFLVRERPLPRRTVYRYLRTTDPVEVDVTFFSCADRLATRGRNAEAATAAHLELAREMVVEALRWRREGPPRSPLRGDELARRLDLEPGRELGALLAELEEAVFAGDVNDAAEALDLARRLRADRATKRRG